MGETNIRTPETLTALRRSRNDVALVRDLLAFYFAHVMSATENFIRTGSPWRDFEFSSKKTDDYLIFQLSVPTGLLADEGKTESIFRDAFIAGYKLRREVDAMLAKAKPYLVWSRSVNQVLIGEEGELEGRFEWQCLLYPEVAAAVQTVFRFSEIESCA